MRRLLCTALCPLLLLAASPGCQREDAGTSGHSEEPKAAEPLLPLPYEEGTPGAQWLRALGELAPILLQHERDADIVEQEVYAHLESHATELDTGAAAWRGSQPGQSPVFEQRLVLVPEIAALSYALYAFGKRAPEHAQRVESRLDEVFAQVGSHVPEHHPAPSRHHHHH